MSYTEYKVLVYDNGSKEWRLNGELHREDGPAVELYDGSKFWYRNGLLHREDGPASNYANGTKYWIRNSEFHREDGPACEFADGSKYWYIDGKQLTEKQFNDRRNQPSNVCSSVVEIDGKKYKLTVL